MSASVTPQVGTKVQIPVARQFRDDLIGKQNRRLIFGLLLYIGVILFFGLVVHWGWHVDFAVPFLLIWELVAWWRQLKTPWFYEIDRNQMTVIWFEVGGHFWRWLPVQWQRMEVTGVEETEWRGLPALRLIRQVKNPNRRPDWLIVYGHEDAERVITQVLPLIEQYRRCYRNPTVAQRLREG